LPYLQPATANYFGFQPVEGDQARTRLYLVSSSEANQISVGDVVVYATHTSGSSIRRATGSTTTDLGLMVGVAANTVLAGDGSTGADFRVASSRTCLVYDDPNTLFYGCDTTSGVIGGGVAAGLAFGVCSSGVTGSTGINTTLNRSVMAVSGVTASSGSVVGYRFNVIALHPVETAHSTGALGVALATSNVRKWILKPSFHANAGLGIGYGHVTT
jgi:hypothetical protein